MWDSSCLDRFLEMRSAFIEVRAIRDDLNARRRKGEHPENKCYESALYRWQDAIAALAEVVYSSAIRSAGPRFAAGPLKLSWLNEEWARRVRISTTAACYQTESGSSAPAVSALRKGILRGIHQNISSQE